MRLLPPLRSSLRLVALTALVAAGSASAQTTLSQGDLAIIAVDANNTGGEQFAFVLLTDVADGTVVRFSDFDMATDGTAAEDGADGVITVDLNALPAGTVVTINANLSTPEVPSQGDVSVTNSGFVLSEYSGDGIIAYQGADGSTPAGGTFLYYVDLNDASSAAPSVLGPDAVVEFGDDDGFAYDTRPAGLEAPTSGTPAALTTAFNSLANYVVGVSTFEPATYLPESFTVLHLPEFVTVTTTADAVSEDDDCSLREAILMVNSFGSADNEECGAANDADDPYGRIVFDIPESDTGYLARGETTGSAGYWRIAVASPLPAVTSGVLIDGFTQPGAVPGTGFIPGPEGEARLPFEGTDSVLKVELTVASCGDATRCSGGPFDGLLFRGSASFPEATAARQQNGGPSRSHVRGLSITGFPGAGVAVSGDNGYAEAFLEGNFIGVQPDGETANGNGVGVYVFTADSAPVFAYIGYPFFGIARQGGFPDYYLVPNVVSGNAIGVLTEGTEAFSFIANNILGTGADATTPVGGSGTAALTMDNASSATLVNSIDENAEGIVNDGGNTRFSGTFDLALSNATPSSVDVAIAGAIPNRVYEVEIYTNRPSGVFDQGQAIVTTETVCVDENGNTSVTLDLSAELPGATSPQAGDFLTATATDVFFGGSCGPERRTASPTPLGTIETEGFAGFDAARMGLVFPQTSEFSPPALVSGGGGTVQFALVQQVVSENAGSAEIEIEASGLSGPTDVTITLASGDPADLGGFTTATTTIGAFGDAPPYVVSVPITDDFSPEQNESFTFTLSVDAPNSVGGGILSLVVADNDGEPVSTTVPTGAGGLRVFSLPINGVTTGEIAEAASADEVFIFDPNTGEFVPAPPETTLLAGQPILVEVAPEADLSFSGGALTGETSFHQTTIGNRVLVPVGSPSGEPIALSALTIEGGTLADVALVFDPTSGAFVPVSLDALRESGSLAIFPNEVVILQIDASDDPDAVRVSVGEDAPGGTGTAISDAAFAPTDGEAAVVIRLQPASAESGRLVADAPGDVLALRFLVGEDGVDAFDGYDIATPPGATLATPGPLGSSALFSALSWSAPTLGDPVAVPLVVRVPEPGDYELTLDAMPDAIEGRPVVVTVFDGTTPTVIEGSAPYRFTVSEGDSVLAGRFAVEVSIGSGVATGTEPSEPSMSVYPNPSAGRATVSLTDVTGDVRVAVYDALGREVAVLHDGPATGTVEATIAPGRLSPGAYIVRASGRGLTQTRSLTVVR